MSDPNKATRVETSVQILPPLPDNLLPHLKTLRYDSTQYVPLLVVNPAQKFVPDTPLPDGPMSLDALASAVHLRVVTTGRLNALVPPTMAQINTKPGKANIFARMSRGELVMQLVMRLTLEQWQMMGSPDGIGVADLDASQRQIWASLLPSHLDLWIDKGESSTTFTNMSAVRLRIRFNDTENAAMATAGAGGNSGSNVAEPKYSLNLPDGFNLSPNADYGVVLQSNVRNVEKPGDVNFASPSLDPVINLHFAPKSGGNLPSQHASNVNSNDTEASMLPTVGDLIERIDEATHLTFIADRRVRDLPVFLRGDSARCGDLLQALARSVCGAFRTLPPSAPGESALYLLTYDREGLGTQMARIADWEDQAERAWSAAQDRADEYSFPRNALAKISASHYSASDGSDSRIPDNKEFTVSLIVPGFGTMEADDLEGMIQGEYRQSEERKRTASQPPKAAANVRSQEPDIPPTDAWPPKLPQRLLFAAPTSAADVTALVQAAHTYGFTGLYLQVSLADPMVSAKLLEAGVRAGRGVQVAIGAAVSLLQGAGLPGEPDRDILGETGAEYAARLTKRDLHSTNPDDRQFFELRSQAYSNWMAPPDADSLTKQVLPIAAVPGLTTLLYQHTTAPGWWGYTNIHPPDDWDRNGRLGYTLHTRRDFLTAYGIDPLDISEQDSNLRFDSSGIQWSLGFFHHDERFHIAADSAPCRAWNAWRADAHRKMMADLYTTLHRAYPALRFAIDDPGSTWFFGSDHQFYEWDVADQLPQDIIDRSHAVRNAGGHGSISGYIPFDTPDWVFGTGEDNTHNTPEVFARRLTKWASICSPSTCDGIALDMTMLPVPDVLRLLTGLPSVPGDAPSVAK